MNTRVIEILDRRAAIRLAMGELCAEDLVLETELRDILETGEDTLDISMFKGTTRSLLTEFLKSANYMLFPDDIRQDVMGLRPDDDETDADGSALRQIIDRARKNIKKHPDFRYEIINIKGKGYQLVENTTLQNVTNQPGKRKTISKKRYGA